MTWFSPQISVPIAPQLSDASAEDQQGLSDGFSPNEFLLQFLRSGGNEEQRTSNNEPNFWDPAVAAHGPSHSFPPHSSPARPLYMAPPPPPPPPLPRFGGWSPHFQQQQDHVFPVNENPFLTPTDHGFLHPYALQVERPFHPPAPYPFPAPPVVAHEQKLRPIQQAFGPPNPEPPDAKRPIEQQWQGTQVETVKDGKQSVQQFHGAGAELLQLLQGGIVRSKLAASPVKNNDNGEASGENSKRGSPSTAHGPIGPPRRQVPSPPESPNDLLGRFWPVLPSSTLVLEETKPEQSPEGIDSLEKSENSCSQEVGNGAGIAGFSLLKRGSPKLPLDGFDCDSKVNGKQKMHLAPVKSHSRYLNGDAEFEQDNERSIGRRRNGGRGEVRRNGGRATAGQWIAVNERPKDVDAADNVESFDSKDEGGGYKSVNGTHSKMRDELKRRRKQQQEWRIKASESKIISNFDKKLPKARSLASQLEHPGLPSGSMDKNSAVGAALDESKQKLYNRMDSDVVDDEELTEYVANLEIDEEENGRRPLHLYRPKESRLRESKRYIPMHRRHITYRPDLQKFTRQLLSLYNDLIPTEEEEIRRRKFLFKLESLFEKELPGARLFLFGSCANAFGVRNSDIDVCLTVDEEEPNKIELVVKMASILESNDMENVQALTHARVPIVKFTEPMTGISCDICVNNMLAVVNSKLLHDYAQIDVRLRQLAFMVKHWAKRRQVNETYRGTLSSYAYVLMCIHFLQQRRPAILPCLQEMPHTYEVKVGNIRCAYYDKVETLRDYGAANKETLGELLTAFFDYWAYRHEYNHAVISVRTGGYLSKDEKEWTRRIGNERHLICIEDPFEITHDLGRVVDKHSIKALRGEFYRAANTMASDVNPCITLFEPYIREQHINHKKVLSSDNI